ncbi:MAG: hypothetical protein IBJ15_02505 [Alphaproteobacteria bacterium]|nr:hypothetical protein [Alphaproteobacteria bacterium]
MDVSYPILEVVHCIDTEGPLYEPIEATFDRIERAFGVKLNPSAATLDDLRHRRIALGGVEAEIARMIDPALIAYNEDWLAIDRMLDSAMSVEFRNRQADDFGNGWVYSWHCVDHLGLTSNPRRKALGYGEVFQFYRNKIASTHSSADEINWHFHPLSIGGNPLAFGTSYVNVARILHGIIARRILDDAWFPTVNRPGFHAERPDSHLFLEQWIPFDYANQADTDDVRQPDLADGRGGDWRRAPAIWHGYHPAHDDYQSAGACRRWIFRCLNRGSRLRLLQQAHVDDAMREAQSSGHAILAFSDHDYRDIRPDVDAVRAMLADAKQRHPDVRIRYAGAAAAARAWIARQRPLTSPPVLKCMIESSRLTVSSIGGALFGPQPFLAIRGRDGAIHHDNFDFQQPGRFWTYTFDDQTIPLLDVAEIGVGSAGLDGEFCVVRLRL